MFLNVYMLNIKALYVEKFSTEDEAKKKAIEVINEEINREENFQLFTYGNLTPDSDGIIKVDILDDTDENNDYWFNKYYKIQTIEMNPKKSYLIVGYENTHELFSIIEFDNKESAKHYFEDELEKLYESLEDAGDGYYTINDDGVVTCEIEPTQDTISERGSLEDTLTVVITRLRDEYFDEVHYFALV